MQARHSSNEALLSKLHGSKGSIETIRQKVDSHFPDAEKAVWKLFSNLSSQSSEA